MASIRKRGDKWQARVKRSGFPDQVKTFLSRSAAERWARSVESSIDQGAFFNRTESDRILFGDLIKRYIVEVCPLHRGGDQEAIRLNATLRHHIAKLNLTNLTSQAIAEYRDQRLLECRPGTVIRDLAVLSAIINHARREWGISLQNAVQMVRKPATPCGRDRVLTGEEESLLIACMRPEGNRNPLTLPIVIFAIETAMRRGEILALRWDHVNLERRTAYLPMTKNGHSRAVPLSSRAIEVLHGLERTSERVFPINAAALDANFKRAKQRASIHNLHFHDLRHTATTRMAEKLPNVLELAAVTGHRSLQMLKRYYHPQAEKIAEKLG